MVMENPAVKPGIENTFQKNRHLKSLKMFFYVNVKPIAKATKIVKTTQ